MSDSDRLIGRFELLIQPEISLLLRVAMRITQSKPEAEDLVQETLIRAYQALGEFDGEFPKAWLLTILRNSFLNNQRKKSPSLTLDGNFFDSVKLAFGGGQSISAEESVLGGFLSAHLVAGLKSLDLRYREVIYLIDVEGLTYEECSSLLGIALGTITSRLSRGRSKLRAYLLETKVDEGRLR